MTNSRRPHIVGVGIACLDYLFISPWAELGATVPLLAHLIQGGGLVGTALVAAARLGASTEIWTWVGDDDEGKQVVAGLRDEGVDVSQVEVVARARTPVSFVHVEAVTGERTIVHGPRLDIPQTQAKDVESRRLSCDALLVDAVWPQASHAVAARARESSIPVVGDFYPHPQLADLAHQVSHLVVPAAATDQFMPEISREQQLRSLAASGPEFIAITGGRLGCNYLDHGAVKHQPAFSVEVVDTTGAGDVFHGAFAYSLAQRWPVAKAMAIASAAAALSCRALGGRTAAPTMEEVKELLKTQGSKRGCP